MLKLKGKPDGSPKISITKTLHSVKAEGLMKKLIGGSQNVTAEISVTGERKRLRRKGIYEVKITFEPPLKPLEGFVSNSVSKDPIDNFSFSGSLRGAYSEIIKSFHTSIALEVLMEVAHGISESRSSFTIL
ncbi:hypothetical protein JXB01_02090 [Candidatus Micrarchaeota archaeon]|nr:hypothetical protein [Candidatus Micrarchaeota archaeon]